ncbi:hypothetical protein MCG45_15930 [Clostridium perfringens]|uniref:hypothetical protein n=1 Tax=Clostridium perfringens TaxID=1502 RepID=UPI001F0588B7|nr:hypothetical protein [Clostridium perfringens]MCH1964319.1 hypothetical protein [Clostridium perfringens]
MEFMRNKTKENIIDRLTTGIAILGVAIIYLSGIISTSFVAAYLLHIIYDR